MRLWYQKPSNSLKGLYFLKFTLICILCHKVWLISFQVSGWVSELCYHISLLRVMLQRLLLFPLDCCLVGVLRFPSLKATKKVNILFSLCSILIWESKPLHLCNKNIIFHYHNLFSILNHKLKHCIFLLWVL